MSQEADEIRQRIEDRRERMGETIDALGYKADIPSRLRDSVSEKSHSIKEAVTGQTHSIKEAVTGQTEGAYESVVGGGKRVGSMAQENPMLLAIGGAAAGFLAGMLFPASRVESERMGPVAQEFKSTITDTASEALERGKMVAEEAMQSAAETVKKSGQEQSRELGEQMRQRVQGM
jgi:gas vesicle protein